MRHNLLIHTHSQSNAQMANGGMVIGEMPIQFDDVNRMVTCSFS